MGSAKALRAANAATSIHSVRPRMAGDQKPAVQLFTSVSSKINFLATSG